MTDIDLTDAAHAVRPYVGCCVDCPHECRADVTDIETILHAALPAIREQLAAQVEALAPDLTEWRSDYRDGRAHMATEAAHTVRGGEWL